MEETTSIFFSYSHADKEHASAIIAALEAAGHSVWWDDNIEGGSAFASTIEEALNAAAAVLVLWSPASIQSHWVSDEADQGRSRGCLVPLTIGGAQPPLGFRQLHFIDMDKWRGDPNSPEFVRLLRAIASYTNGDAPPAPHVIPPQPKPAGLLGVSRRTMLIAGGATVSVGALGLGGLALFSGSGALAKNGVAVLPFRNLSGDPEQDYLSAGLSAEVRTVLARNAALKVVAQTSSEAVKERAMSAGEMAKTLAVSFLLDGNVNKTGDKLRVAADLIDGRTGFSRWTETFDMPIGELLTIQAAIADAVTRELASNKHDKPGEEHYGVTTDAGAFNDYLKGKELYAAAISYETDLQALALFDSALQRDPSFSAAHAARARLLTVLGNTSDDVEKAKLYYETARQAAQRAVDAGAQSADAYSTLGFVLFQAQLRIADAREPYQKSFELGQGDAVILARFAAFAASTKQFGQAEKAILKARSLDPLNATIHRALGFVHYAAGRYEQSMEAVERALSLNPKLSDSHARIAMALIALGRPEEALVAAEKEKSNMVRYPAVAIANHQLGNEEASVGAMAALIEQYGDAGAYQQAQIQARTGEADKAMNTLVKAEALGDSGLTYAFIDPTLDSLREREDFRQLLVRLGYV